MRATKSIWRRRRRSKLKKEFDLQLTSLMDILVIILVFLLKTYDVTSVSFAIPAGMTLPLSSSPAYGEDGLNVVVSINEIAVGAEEILRFKEGSIQEDGTIKGNPIDRKYLEDRGRLIVPLYEALRLKKEAVEVVAASTGGTPFTGILNLVADKRINYYLVKRILYTAAASGFKKVKFSVQKRET